MSDPNVWTEDICAKCGRQIQWIPHVWMAWGEHPIQCEHGGQHQPMTRDLEAVGAWLDE
jgi:hypothetical protein